MDVETKVRSVFVDAQRSTQARMKLVSRMKKAQEGAGQEEIEDKFYETFTEHVKHSLVVFNREAAVERTIEFIVAFATEESKAQIKKEPQAQDGNFSDDEDEDLMSPFLTNFFNFLLDFHDSHSKAVRFRVCQIINKLFDALADEISIDEDLASRVYDCMLIRLTDKFPSIRVQAVKAIYRLQDIQDPNCPVIDSFVHLMQKDSSPDVRRAALQSIAVTPKTLGPILDRTRDVKDAVRKSAYEILGEKIKIKSLTIAQRLKLLENGLNDRSKIVKEACIGKLMKAWLQDLDNHVDRLLKCLHIESSPETAVLALKAFFQDASVETLKKHIEALMNFQQATTEQRCVLISQACLGPEVAMYWRVLAEHVKSLNDNDELMELVLPLASEFCDYVQRYAESNKLFDKTGDEDETMQQSEFIMQQLLHLCACLDYSDEIGRQRMQALTRKLLLSEDVPFTLVETLVARFAEMGPNEEKFVQSLVEFISEIKEPLVVEEVAQSKEEMRKRELELAKLRIKLNELREALDDSVKGEDFTKAAEIKEQIAELEEKSQNISLANQPQNQTIRIEKNDPFTILKCLYIATEMLKKVQKRSLSPTIQSLAELLIWPSVQEEDLLIRNAAVKCLGLISLLSKEFASENFVLFLQAAQIDVELVQITATQVIFDLIQVYGFDTFEIDQAKAKPVTLENDTTKQTSENEEIPVVDVKQETYALLNENANETANASSIILNALMMLLDGESADIRFVVAEGMCKLLLSGRIRSAKIYARLVLLWYNPAVEDDFKLRQCLGVFLPNFALASRGNQELVEESFFPILQTLFDAPDTSPLAEIDPLSVVELLVQLTNLRNRKHHVTLNENRTNIDQDFNIHDSLAVRVANEILSDTTNTDVRTLCKALTMLELSSDNQNTIKDLSILSTRIQEHVEDKVSKKLIQKFQVSLRLADQSAGPMADENFVVLESVAKELDENDKTIAEEKRISRNTPPKDGTEMPAPKTNQGKSNRRTASKNKPLKSGNKKSVKKETNQRKSTVVNDECQTSSDSASSEKDEDVQPTKRQLSSRSSKKKSLEKAKINLELILTSDESDSNDEEVPGGGSPDSDECTF